MDAAASGEQVRAGRMMLKRTAKSCGSDAPGLASSLREDAQATVATKPGRRGEHEVSRETIARGMPGDFRCDRGDYARVLISSAREAAGASRARHSLRPLFSERAKQCLQTSGAPRREIAESYFEFGVPSLRGAKRRSNPCHRCSGCGLLRFARNDAVKARRTPNCHRPRKRAIQYSRDVND